MWTVSCSNTSFSFSVLCSVSMLSSSSSDFCNSTREALDTLKIPWILTRTFTLTFELSPEAWGTTFWTTYWPAWEFQRTCLHVSVQWKYAMRRKEHVHGPEYLPPLQVADALRRKVTDNKKKTCFCMISVFIAADLLSCSSLRSLCHSPASLWGGTRSHKHCDLFPRIFIVVVQCQECISSENYFPAKTLNVHITRRLKLW